jgi:Domain of unknown function (DUF4836)
MKSKNFYALLLLFAGGFLMSSCSKNTNTQGRYVPETASAVVHINAASISAKLPWEEIKQNEIFQEAYADSTLSSFAKSALDNPENTGVDAKKDLIFFTAQDSSGSYMAFEGSLKDAAKFKTYNTSALKNGVPSQKNGVEFISTDQTTVSWDDSKFIVITNLPDNANKEDMQSWMDEMEGKMQHDSTNNQTPSDDLQTKKILRNGVATAAQLYTLPEGSSLARQERFSELIQRTGDIHFWLNAASIKQVMPPVAQLGMINLDKIYEGAIATGTVNFENGRIDVDMKCYAGKEMTAVLKKYAGSSISDDMVKRIPAKDIAFFLAINFKPEGIKELLKVIGLEGLANMGASFLGFGLNDFVKANNGDIVLAVSDIVKDSSGITNASVIFSAAVADKPSFDKLIAAGKKGMKQGMVAMNSEIYFNSNEKYFAIGNNRTNIDQFLSKEGSSKFDFYDKIKASPIAGYVNFQYLMTAFRETADKDSLALAAFDASAKMWDNAVMSGGNFKEGGITQHFEINLVDKSTGSLKQLNMYMAKMAHIAKAKKKENSFVLDEEIQPGDVIAKPQ